MRRLTVGLSLALTGCSAFEPNASPDPVVELGPGPSATATATASALTRREDVPPSKLDAWTLPELKGPKLGTPCTPRVPTEDGDRKGPDTCGAAGRVSMEWEQYRPMRGERPCEMHTLGPEDRRQLYATSACTDGDHAVFTSDCMVCRSTSGWSAHVRLSELTAAQSEYLFKRLAYDDAKGGPTTPAGWKKLIEGAPSEAKPAPPAP